jgi:hypothetical protein
MTPAEAVKFLTDAAWRQHKQTCKCVPLNPVNPREKICDCGAYEHNLKIKPALMTIAGKAR